MSTTNIGTTVSFFAGLPATFTEAGYEAITWLPVNGLVAVGEIGDEHATVEQSDLTLGRKITMKGRGNGQVCAYFIARPTCR